MASIRPWTALTLVIVAASARAGAQVELQVRDNAGTAVPGAVVYLEGSSHPESRTPAPVVIDQRDKVFVPEVTVVQTGTGIVFPNSDSVSHHVYSFAQPNAFELPLYKGGTRPTVRFDHAGVVTLGCNIHDAMLGYVVVVDTPWFAKADSTGAATVADVAPGTYAVQVWSPRLDPRKPLSAGSITVGGRALAQTVAVARKLRTAPGAGGALSAGDY